MRRTLTIIVAAAALATPAWCTAAPTPLPTQTQRVEAGSRTSGLAGNPVPQPAPPPKVDVRPSDVPSGSGPDTPGKTGLGNSDRDPLGGAGRGPGTRPNSGGYP